MRPDGCPSRDELRAFSRGGLAGATLDDVAGHLATCPDCRRDVRGLEVDDPWMAALRQPAPAWWSWARPDPAWSSRGQSAEASGFGCLSCIACPQHSTLPSPAFVHSTSAPQTVHSKRLPSWLGIGRLLGPRRRCRRAA